MATFIFFLAMALGVLPFVEGLVLGWPLQAVIGGVIAAFFLVAGHLARHPDEASCVAVVRAGADWMSVHRSEAVDGIKRGHHSEAGDLVGNTVLVVDDRPDARYSMARPLAAAGFDVRETATGREALRLARLQVDAIVLDLVLPDMDGYDVLRKLKDDPATHNIPVILKTAVYLDDGHRQVALDAGAAEYFAKPFDTQALITTVRRVLGDGASPGSPAKP